MGTTKASTTGPKPESSAEERLESWKEIAGHFKRGVSTVQRWEREEGLPVHRHLHDKQGTIYAFRSELDAWWGSRRAQLQNLDQNGQVQGGRFRWVAIAVVGLLAITASGAFLWLRRPAPIPFQKRDWVLITRFENRTGEAVLDGTLEYALERELSNSRFVNVVPRERVADTLLLMKRPSDTPITATLGREICLRDDGIKALLTGRVEKLDTTYVLSAILVEPGRGVTVSSFSEDARGQKEIVPAIRRLSNHVRETLGEKLSSIEQTNQKLAKVTTPSLRALQLYTRADAVIARDRRGNEVAEELLKQAITEDREFASAYIHLAWAIRNQGRPTEEVQQYARRAVELSGTASDRERYFILGSYYQQTGQVEKAIAAYEALLRLYPDHFWATNNLSAQYFQMGRAPEAIPYVIRRAELRPNDFITNIRAAQAITAAGSSRVQAEPYYLRARALASPEVVKQNPDLAAWMEMASWYDYWLRGEMGQALAEVNRVAQTLHSRQEVEREALAQHAGFFYLTLGKLKAAEVMFEKMSVPADRNEGLAELAFARGDSEALKRHLSNEHELIGSFAALLMAQAGLLSGTEKAISESRKRGLSIGYIEALEGSLARARGQRSRAISLLQDSLQRTRHTSWGTYLLASESLADTWENQGDFQKALQVLEEASQPKMAVLYPPSGILWIRNQWHLAQLYRKLGRRQDAEKVEDELEKLLAYADPDYPILVALKKVEKQQTAQAIR